MKSICKMVSLGTILTLGAVGAIIAGGYAVYRNADKIGGGISRGVEETLVTPLGKWADSLWSGIANSSQGPTSGPSSIAGQTVESYKDSTIFIPKDTFVNPDGTVTSSTPPLLNLSPEEKSSAIIALEENKLKTIAENEAFDKTFSKAGYYYFDVAGSKYDTQQYLSAQFATDLFKADPSKIFSPGGLENVTYIGQSALQEAGFKLFGKSKGYL